MAEVFSPHFINQTNQRLLKLTPQTQGKWGKMTVAQMLTHLNDSFKLAMGMKPATDRSNVFTRKILFPVSVYGLPAWPKGFKAPYEISAIGGGSTARDFYTELEFLKKMIDVFNEREAAKFKPHPLFGPLTKKQWRDLLVKHIDYHLKQFGV